MKKKYKIGTIICSLLILQLQLFVPVFAQEATSSASDIASSSGNASPGGFLKQVATQSTNTSTQNPFSDNGATSSKDDVASSVSSLLNMSLGNTGSAGSALIKQKSVIHALGRKNFKQSESVNVNVGNATADNVAVSIIDIDGKAIDPSLIDKKTIDTQTTVTIHPPTFGFRPGKYTIHITDADGTTSTQDFTWGVLAMNMDKSIYMPNETAHLAIAVLNDQGNMVCDANVSLEITDPQGNKTFLSTAAKTIAINPQCLSHAFSLVPDYETSYQVGQQGNYSLVLSAATKNGTNTITDSLQAQQSVSFDVIRTSATRIYPINSYPMMFHIKANQDFTGTVREYAPANFDISPYATGSAQTYDTSSLVVPSIDMQESFGTPIVSLEKPFIGNFPMVQGFGVALTDPLEKAFYAAFGLAGHDGLDFAMPIGTPIAASDDGVVSLAGDGAYGTTIVIDHTWGRSYYGHLSKTEVTVGEHVTKGEEIGLSGNTGHTTGPHLHFGIKPVHANNENGFYGKVDPTSYLNFLNGDKPVLGVSTSTVGNVPQKVVTWNISVKKGDTIDLAYSYKAPNISPQFYTAGPLTFYNSNQLIQFQEARQWQIAVDAAPTSAYSSGSSTAIGTGPTPTTIGTVPTSFPNSNNVVIAIVTFNTTSASGMSVAANALILKNGSTTLTSNAESINLGTGNLALQTVSYSFVYNDSGAGANPTYNVVATAAATGLNAQVKLLVINGIAQSTFADGTDTLLGTADTSLASTTMGAAGDNIVVAAVNLSNTNTANTVTIAAGAIKLMNNTTPLTSNTFSTIIGPTTTGKDNNEGMLLVYRDPAASASKTYTVKASASIANDIQAQVRLLVFNGVNSAFTDGASTAVSNTSDTTVASVPTTFAAATNLLIAGTQVENSTSTTGLNIAAGNQKLKSGTTLLSSNQYIYQMNATGIKDRSKGNGFVYQDSGALASPTYNLTDLASAAGINGAGKVVALSLAAPVYTQATYRLFNNLNSTDVGSPLAAQNTAATLTSAGEAFRIRMNINLTNNQLGQSAENFKLQYVDPGTGTCAAPSGGTPSSYTDVTGSTLIAYNTNSLAVNGNALTVDANDPTDGGITIVNETYQSANTFTNSVSWIPSSQDGMWDFSLIDNTGGNGKTYCVRAVVSDGTGFATYTNIPMVTTLGVPTLDQLMRHGKWFLNGAEQPFTF